MNLVLDIDTHDLTVVTGQLQLTSGPEDIAQALKCRLLLVKGEWYLHPDKGIDYFNEVFVKRPDLGVVKALFVTAILEDPRIIKIQEMNVNFDRASRTYFLDFTVQTESGPVKVTGLEVVP